jgi:hypothetical protein
MKYNFDAERRVWDNLERFGMHERRQASRCLARLRLIAPLSTPRWWAAALVLSGIAGARLDDVSCCHALLVFSAASLGKTRLNTTAAVRQCGSLQKVPSAAGLPLFSWSAVFDIYGTR